MTVRWAIEPPCKEVGVGTDGGGWEQKIVGDQLEINSWESIHEGYPKLYFSLEKSLVWIIRELWARDESFSLEKEREENIEFCHYQNKRHEQCLCKLSCTVFQIDNNFILTIYTFGIWLITRIWLLFSQPDTIWLVGIKWSFKFWRRLV